MLHSWNPLYNKNEKVKHIALWDTVPNTMCSIVQYILHILVNIKKVIQIFFKYKKLACSRHVCIGNVSRLPRMQHSFHRDWADRVSVYYDTAKMRDNTDSWLHPQKTFNSWQHLPPSLSPPSLSFPRLVRAAIFTCTALWQTSFK